MNMAIHDGARKAYLLRFMDGSGRVVIARSFGEAVEKEFEQVVSGREIEGEGKE